MQFPKQLYIVLQSESEILCTTFWQLFEMKHYLSVVATVFWSDLTGNGEIDGFNQRIDFLHSRQKA